MSDFTLVDFGFSLVVLISTWWGFTRGAIVDTVVTVIFFGAIIGALLFGPVAGYWVLGLFDASASPWAAPIGFIVLFLVIYIAGGFIRRSLSYSIEESGLAATDRTVGIILGFARGMLLVLVIIACIVKWSEDSSWLTTTFFYSLLEPFYPDVRAFVDFVASE